MRKSIIRQVLTASFAIVVAALPAAAQTCPNAARLTAGLKGPIATVRYLSDDALQGRLAGSPGERCAGDFIAARFKALGLKAAGDSGTYFQSFSLASVTPHAPTGTGRNVVAILPGADSRLRDEYIIIGAHYDHLGMGEFGSTSTDGPAIHNGADDNASGVAALLEAAARLKVAPRPARSIVFIAFTGEEEGLLGSAYYANNAELIKRSHAMLNMDMVGRLGAGPLIVYGIGSATEWKDVVSKVAAKENVELTLLDDAYGASDHTSFYLKDIPVLHFFSNVHGDYHKPSDDWEKIDSAGLMKVSRIVTNVARAVASNNTPLTLVKGAGKPPSNATGGYGAYLGTVPDFTPVPKGVKLSGVRENSPAANAGLRAGDIIIAFDSTEIKDLQGMTDALRARKPGDAVRITVLRDGKEVSVDAVLGKR
jgi:hypothetical protein